jgi:hypothetical protein
VGEYSFSLTRKIAATRSPIFTRDTPFPVVATIPTPSDRGTRPSGGFPSSDPFDNEKVAIVD